MARTKRTGIRRGSNFGKKRSHPAFSSGSSGSSSSGSSSAQEIFNRNVIAATGGNVTIDPKTGLAYAKGPTPTATTIANKNVTSVTGGRVSVNQRTGLAYPVSSRSIATSGSTTVSQRTLASSGKKTTSNFIGSTRQPLSQTSQPKLTPNLLRQSITAPTKETLRDRKTIPVNTGILTFKETRKRKVAKDLAPVFAVTGKVRRSNLFKESAKAVKYPINIGEGVLSKALSPAKKGLEKTAPRSIKKIRKAGTTIETYSTRTSNTILKTPQSKKLVSNLGKSVKAFGTTSEIAYFGSRKVLSKPLRTVAIPYTAGIAVGAGSTLLPSKGAIGGAKLGLEAGLTGAFVGSTVAGVALAKDRRSRSKFIGETIPETVAFGGGFISGSRKASVAKQRSTQIKSFERQTGVKVTNKRFLQPSKQSPIRDTFGPRVSTRTKGQPFELNFAVRGKGTQTTLRGKAISKARRQFLTYNKGDIQAFGIKRSTLKTTDPIGVSGKQTQDKLISGRFLRTDRYNPIIFEPQNPQLRISRTIRFPKARVRDTSKPSTLIDFGFRRPVKRGRVPPLERPTPRIQGVLKLFQDPALKPTGGRSKTTRRTGQGEAYFTGKDVGLSTRSGGRQSLSQTSQPKQTTYRDIFKETPFSGRQSLVSETISGTRGRNVLESTIRPKQTTYRDIFKETPSSGRFKPIRGQRRSSLLGVGISQLKQPINFDQSTFQGQTLKDISGTKPRQIFRIDQATNPIESFIPKTSTTQTFVFDTPPPPTGGSTTSNFFRYTPVIPPNINKPKIPPGSVRLPFGGGGSSKGFNFFSDSKLKTKYSPSLVSSVLSIKTKKKKTDPLLRFAQASGLGIRPLLR